MSLITAFLSAILHGVGTIKIRDDVIENANALWAASASGHLEIVEWLVKMGMNANCVIASKNTSSKVSFENHS